MHKLRYLRIQFAPEISDSELPKFRGAIIKAVDPDNVLFHNHIGDSFRYSYPLIQYKKIRGKAVLVCTGDGVDSIHDLFQKRLLNLTLGHREIPFAIENLELKEFTLQLFTNREFSYRLDQWLPLNEEHYTEYMKMTDEADRLRFLHSILRGNILSFAKGIGWQIDGEVKVRITHCSKPRSVKFKSVRLMSFSIQFYCNVSMPPYIGLGKGVSTGFGILGKTWVDRREKAEIIPEEIETSIPDQL